MEASNLLSDPLNDRVVTEVPLPPHRPLSRELLFPRNDLPDWCLLKEHLRQEGRLSKADACELIRRCTSVFQKEKNLLEVRDPVTIVGDIHGQFHDLLRLLDLGGDPSGTKYLFLGDYVDRGMLSVEVLLLLYALKINFPSSIFMIRGNHECRQMTTFFNFRDECLAKFDLEFYELVMESFDVLPLACIVNNKFLALHGGISPEMVTLSDLSKINRFSEPPRQGLFCDILWADPVDNDTGTLNEKFKSNQVRGCSYYYGKDAANAFLKKNRLISILRAHEAQLEGYKMHRWNGNNEFPPIITIFSAPNYCDVYNNKGAVLKFSQSSLNVQQFNYTPHPYILPNFMNVFSWSTPFVIEKVLEMLCQLIKPEASEKAAREEETEPELIKKMNTEVRESKVEMFRNKVRAVSKMMKMFKTLREDKEIIMELKGLCPDNRVPRGLLQEGRDAIVNALDSFNTAKEWDIVNEKRPDN